MDKSKIYYGGWERQLNYETEDFIKVINWFCFSLS